MNSRVLKSDFGQLIRQVRTELGIGQRELARRINVSASYLNEMEQGKRPAPTEAVLDDIKDVLDIDDEIFYDLAGASRCGIAPDIQKFIQENNSLNSLLRVIQNTGYSENKILELKNMITSQNYKASLLRRFRLGSLTKNTPKCMLGKWSNRNTTPNRKL